MSAGTRVDAAAAEAGDPLRLVVYVSRATVEFDDGELGALLQQSRDRNRHEQLTGVLLYRDGRFLQVLEGPPDGVRDRMDAILADPRHAGLWILADQIASDRLFPRWTMGYEKLADTPTPSADGYRSDVEDLGSDSALATALPALRELVRWYSTRP